MSDSNINVTPGSGGPNIDLQIIANGNARQAVVLGDPNTTANVANVTAAGALQVDSSATTQPVSGTVTVNPLTNTSSIDVWISDGTGNDITSQVNGSQRAIDVGIDVAGVQVDPRSIRALTSADTVTSNIKGGSGATLDGTIGAATAPTNGVAVLTVAQTSAPSLTVGQSVAMQCDYTGSLFVKPHRRSETTSKATTIAASTTPTTVLAAQASGIFADISSLIITAAAASTVTAFTCTLSDGTNSYIFDVMTGLTTTATPGLAVNAVFNPPLPATNASTAWTITNSSATPTVHITVVAVLQKAS